MALYINVLKRYASDVLHPWTFESQNAENNFETWSKAINKHELESFYYNFYFCAVYVERLYEARVRSFLMVLKESEIYSDIQNAIRNGTTIVSFACGPGPEIAAYLSYCRNKLNMSNKILTITAIDKIDLWKSFIDKIKHLDRNATIEFKCGILGTAYLQRMNRCDVCIMSYGHSMNLEPDVWRCLKEKFSLILILDQPKNSLIRCVERYGFQTHDFFLKGRKIFFYYVSKQKHPIVPSLYQNQPICPRRYLCSNELHESRSFASFCREYLEISLICQHKRSVVCHSVVLVDKSNNYINDLDQFDFFTSIYCDKLCNRPLGCGHFCQKQCYECIPPMLHSKCQQICNRTLTCGHKCSQICHDGNCKYCKHCYFWSSLISQLVSYVTSFDEFQSQAENLENRLQNLCNTISTLKSKPNIVKWMSYVVYFELMCKNCMNIFLTYKGQMSRTFIELCSYEVSRLDKLFNKLSQVNAICGYYNEMVYRQSLISICEAQQNQVNACYSNAFNCYR